jgi:hypothetical protein
VDGGGAVSAGIHRDSNWWIALRSIHPSMIILEASVLLQVNPFLPAVRTINVASSAATRGFVFSSAVTHDQF